MNLFKHRHF
jgi:IS6 family transposase